MKTYHGYKAGSDYAVEVTMSRLERRSVCTGDDGAGDIRYFLRSRLDLQYHCPGFDWGQEASTSPMLQLSLALLADAMGGKLAMECYEDFQRTVVAMMPTAWKTTDE